MNNITIKKGSIFDALYLREVQTIVNTVNCEGVMGKGIALVYKLFFPDMFTRYAELCKDGELTIGKLWLYKPSQENKPWVKDGQPWVLNFPTKTFWRAPSKLEFIEKGLQKFVETYKERGITSIAFPMLGTANGQLDPDLVLELLKSYLSQCDIPIMIYMYSSEVPDLYCELFKKIWSSLSDNQKKDCVNNKSRREILDKAIASGKLKSVLDIINEEGIGLKTLEACFEKVLTQAVPSQELF